jgi:diacylglycerol kinase family enzyme
MTIRQHIKDPNFKLSRTTHLTFSATDPLPVHVDAETIGTTPIKVDIVPQALTVMVPHHAPQRLFAQK